MFTQLLEEAYSYAYLEEPNYGKLKFLIKKMIIKHGYLPDKILSWTFIQY